MIIPKNKAQLDAYMKSNKPKSVQWQVNDQFGYDDNPYAKSLFGDGNYLGGNFDYLNNKYKGMVDGNNEAVDAFRKFGTKQAGQIRGRGMRTLEEFGAQSGFSGSVNMNMFNQLLEQEATGIDQTNTKALEMEQGIKERALNSLMGLNEFEGKMNMAEDQFSEGIRQFDITTEEGRKRFRAELALGQRNYELQKDAQDFNFGDFAGKLVGSAVGGFAGGFGASWADSLFGEEE